MPNWLGHKYFAWTLGLVIILLVVMQAVSIQNQVKEGRFIGKPENVRDTIQISGEGKVVGIPDTATVNVGIRNTAKDAGLAQEQNAKQFNALLAALKSFNIDDKDFKTSNYNVYPQYDYPDGSQRLIGYEVSQQVEVTIRNLDEVGNILAAAAQNGSNEVSQLMFKVDEPETLLREARREALAQAREKAEDLADLLGVKLGKIVSFSEGSNQPYPQPIYARSLDSAAGSAEKFVSPDIQEGSQEFIVNATIEFEIF